MADIDAKITTVGDICRALKKIDEDVQVYTMKYDEDLLYEITEIVHVLQKNKEDVGYIVLRSH
jgi:hypothetical protein